MLPYWFAAMALGLGIGVEFFVLRGDISRMNTVFKFYLQAWVLFAVAVSPLVVELWKGAKSRGFVMRVGVRISLVLVLVAVAAYPVTAPRARLQSRLRPDAPHTLDGLAFLESATIEHGGRTIPLGDDLAGIRWLRENAVGLPVLAEATTHPQLYGWGARFSTHTGFPAIIGWDWHQRQQYAAMPVDVITPRIEDLKRLYETADLQEARRLLSRYGVEYLIVGALEEAVFGAEGIGKFAAAEGSFLEVAFREESLVIYRVVPSDAVKP